MQFLYHKINRKQHKGRNHARDTPHLVGLSPSLPSLPPACLSPPPLWQQISSLPHLLTQHMSGLVLGFLS